MAIASWSNCLISNKLVVRILHKLHGINRDESLLDPFELIGSFLNHHRIYIEIPFSPSVSASEPFAKIAAEILFRYIVALFPSSLVTMKQIKQGQLRAQEGFPYLSYFLSVSLPQRAVVDAGRASRRSFAGHPKFIRKNILTLGAIYV